MPNYMQDLEGKVALVTGSARRIGAVTVRVLHQAGATVVVHYLRSAEEGERLCEELNAIRPQSCICQQADLSEFSAINELVHAVIKKAGRLDILVNNASSFYPTDVGSITEEDWDNITGSNLKAPLFLSQAAAPYLTKSKGCIVNMVDIYGVRPLVKHPVYSVAKAGLVMLTKSLAKELGPNVRVNGIAPGAIIWPEEGMGTDEQQQLLEKTCLKRVGSPEDIAKAILFLIRDADYITGHILPVDGGRMVNQ